MQAIPLAARQQPDFLLLIRPTKVEARQICSAVQLFLADHDELLATGDLLPRALVAVERTTLIAVGDLHGFADGERSTVRRLLSDDHSEQRRLAGAVRADDPDD